MILSAEDIQLLRRMQAVAMWGGRTCMGDIQKISQFEAMTGIDPTKFVQQVHNFRKRFECELKKVDLSQEENV